MDALIGFVIGALIANTLLSLLVGYVAGQKGRSAVAFFWLAFFTSFLIGILVAMAVPRVENSAPSQAASRTGKVAKTASGTSVKCPFCAEWVSSEAKVCKHCGREIADEVRAALDAEQQAEEALRLEEVARSAAAQAQVKANEDEKARKRAEFRASKGFKLMVIAGIALVALGTAFGIFKAVQWSSYQESIEALTGSLVSHSQFTDRANDAIDMCEIPSSSYEFDRIVSNPGDAFDIDYTGLMVDPQGLSANQLDCVSRSMFGVDYSFWTFGMRFHNFGDHYQLYWDEEESLLQFSRSAD